MPLGAVEGLPICTDCEREWREKGLGRISSSASETACGLRTGVEDFKAAGSRGFVGEVGRASGDGSGALLGLLDRIGWISGSSGIVSVGIVLEATLEVLVVDAAVGDRTLRVGAGFGGGPMEDLVLVGLAVLARVVIGGRFGATVVGPIVVLRDLSAVPSGLDVTVPVVDILLGRRFSIPSPDVTESTSDATLAAGFFADAIGLVGGLLIMLLPGVLDASALLLPATTALAGPGVFAAPLEEVMLDAGLFAVPSAGALDVGVFALVALRFSIVLCVSGGQYLKGYRIG